MSWYEASAFCTFLTEQLADLLPPGLVLRLPTEAEWEAATAFDAGLQRHIYPWGETPPTSAHAILRDAHLAGAPAPVGCCPSGAAACGAADLLGNVEEWCANAFSTYPDGSSIPVADPPSAGDLVLGPLTAGQLAVRGGWWMSEAAQITCGNRFWRAASAFSQSIGFRIILAPARS